MSISGDTDDLLDTALWGETVTVIRNTISYNDVGVSADSWASVATPHADIQPLAGETITGQIGETRRSTHRIFMPNATNVRQGDRVRPSGWVTGDDEYQVEEVMSDEGHIEIWATLVKGHA